MLPQRPGREQQSDGDLHDTSSATRGSSAVKAKRRGTSSTVSMSCRTEGSAYGCVARLRRRSRGWVCGWGGGAVWVFFVGGGCGDFFGWFWGGWIVSAFCPRFSADRQLKAGPEGGGIGLALQRRKNLGHAIEQLSRFCLRNTPGGFLAW